MNFIFVAVLLSVLFFASHGQHQIFLDSVKGFDNEKCLHYAKLLPCKSFDMALKGIKMYGDLNILVAEGEYQLMTSSPYKGGQLAIWGYNGRPVATVQIGAQLAFEWFDSVRIRNITFVGCGGGEVGKSLRMSYCNKVVLDGVELVQGCGVGIANALERVEVVDCSFSRNLGTALGINSTQDSVNSRTSSVFYTISGNVFAYNIGLNGGAISIVVVWNDKNTEINISLKANTFSANSAVRHGGALYLDIDLSCPSTLIISKCDFTRNKAAQKGGGMYYISTSNVFQSKMTSVFVSGCVWSNNSAGSSAAIYATQISVISALSWFPTDSTPHIVLENCSFVNNRISLQFNMSVSVNEYGVFVTFKVPVLFTGCNNFTFNQASAVCISSTGANLLGELIFDKNIGVNGGGIAVYDNGVLILGKDLDATFSGNMALNKGPALYFAHLSTEIENCFVRFAKRSYHPIDWTAQMRFINNTHGYGMNGSIYVSSLDLCTVTDRRGVYTLSDVFSSSNWYYGTTTVAKTWRDEVITGPKNMYQKQEMNVQAGVDEAIPLLIADELGHDQSGSTSLTFLSNGRNHMVQTYYSNQAYSSTPFIDLHMSFTPKRENTYEQIKFLSLENKIVSSSIHVYIGHCSPGLVPMPQGMCDCPQPIPHFLACYHDWYFNLVMLKNNWLITFDEEQDNLYMAPIQLYHYSRSDRVSHNVAGYYSLTSDSQQLNNFTCGPLNRMGMLCSKCKEGTGTAANTYEFPCVPCSQQDQWKQLTLNIVLQVVPALMFCLLITVTSFNVLSGLMNAFVLFSQVLTNPLLVSHLHYQFSMFGKFGDVLFNMAVVPYGIWNLDFFKSLIPPVCLAPGLDNMQVWAFQYVSAVLPLVLILMLVVLTELHATGFKPVVTCFQPFCKFVDIFRRRWKLRTNLVSTLAALFVLSYTKICAISIFLIIPAQVYVLSKDANTTTTKYILYLDGGATEYLSKGHLPYFITALLCLVVFVLGPAVFLILHSLNMFNKFRCCNRFTRPFADIFQGSYKDGTKENERDYRFFSGIHLLLRFIVLIFINVQYNDGVRYLLLPLMMGMVTITYAFLQPYKSRKANLCEAILFNILLSVVMIFAPLNAADQPLGDSIGLVLFLWIVIMIPNACLVLSVAYKVTIKKCKRFRIVSDDELTWPHRLLINHSAD